MSALPTTIREILDQRETDRYGLFKIYNDLRRQARDSQDPELHTLVAEAYRAYLRAHLDADERALLDAQDEIAELRAEVGRWRRGERKPEGRT